MNELTKMTTLSSGKQTRVAAKSRVDSLEGTVARDCDSMACPQMVRQLYKGLMKVYANRTNVPAGISAVVEQKDEGQG